MTSTNEDVVVLATAPSDDGKQLLVLRHLPDRGTIFQLRERITATNNQL
jgi:hypothetical protein